MSTIQNPVKKSVKFNVLSSLYQRFGSRTFKYTGIVKEILLHNGWIKSYEDYNWRIHRGYYAVSLTGYSSDYFFNFSKTCPLRLVKTSNNGKSAYRVEIEEYPLSSHEETTLNVLKSIKENQGPSAISNEGHKTIQKLEDKKRLSETVSNIMESSASSSNLFQTESLIRKLIIAAFEAGKEDVTYDDTYGYSSSMTGEDYYNMLVQNKL